MMMFICIKQHLSNIRGSIHARKYNIRSDVNSDLSIATMRRVAITFFELGVVKKIMQKF